MDRTPPRNEKGTPGSVPHPRNKIRRLRHRITVTHARRQWNLVTARFQAGLLYPFRCAGCGTVHLDPIGRTGRAWFCDRCADEGGRL